jgi:hypothetical protein
MRWGKVVVAALFMWLAGAVAFGWISYHTPTLNLDHTAVLTGWDSTWFVLLWVYLPGTLCLALFGGAFVVLLNWITDPS